MSGLQHDSSKSADTIEAIPELEQERIVLLKVSLRLLPFVFLMYMMNILDRNNVGFARLQMLRDLNLSEQIYSLAGSIFFVGYFVFEVPSNLMLRRVGARVWISRIMISWGLISTGMMFINSAASFCVLRFLLGIAEAGFFPGIIYYLSGWFPARECARAMSRFMTASAVTAIIGGPVSGAILKYMNGVGGLRGWQWLFLIEGVPAVLIGVAIFYLLTDRPQLAAWLTPNERSWLARLMENEEKHRAERHGLTLWRALAYPRVWLLSAIYFTVSMGANSYGLYGPKILSDRFPDFSEFIIGCLFAGSGVVAVVCMIVVGILSDRHGARRGFVAGTAFVAALGWAVVAVSESPVITWVGLTIAYASMMSMLAPFWTLPTSFLSGAAAAGGIALINSLGNLGGSVAPNVIGFIKKTTDDFTGGWIFLCLALVLGGTLALLVRQDSSLDQRPLP